MLWKDLFSAIALVMILEGILPFIFPVGWKRVMLATVNKSDKFIRIIGLFSMILGVIFLSLIR